LSGREFQEDGAATANARLAMCSRYCVGYGCWMGDRVRVGKPSRYVTTAYLGQLSLSSLPAQKQCCFLFEIS